MSIAVVLWDVASEPASGSERQKAPVFSPVASGTKYFCFCSSLPNFYNKHQTKLLFTEISKEIEASILEISSIAKT